MIKAGTIIAVAGFALMYIVYQFVPLFILLSAFFNEGEYKKMSLGDILFLPLLGIVSLSPIVGLLVTYQFVPDKSKTLQIVAAIACYLIVIGTVLLIIGFCRS